MLNNEIKIKKANDFYEILNAVEFNKPILSKEDEFFVDFKDLRKGFSEVSIYKNLHINPKTMKCNDLNVNQIIFLSGHKGTGKTTELLKLKNEINDTGCFLTIYCDVANEKSGTNDMDIVDIIIFMLEKLVKELQDKDIEISNNDIESFYKWYNQRIVEINNNTDKSATIEIEASAGINLLSFYKLLARTKAKLSASQNTKDTIRRVFTNNFPAFSIKFNEFILNIKEIIRKKDIAKDLLFIIDGFEKVGSYKDRKRILIDESDKFVEIKSNMILTLPIELFSKKINVRDFSTLISLPLITLDDKGIKKFKEFIYKRINKNLFIDETVVENIIKYGLGSPRETLQMIQNSYMIAQDDIIDMKSVEDAKEKLSNEIVDYLSKEEIEVLNNIQNNEDITYDEIIGELLSKKAILEYGDGTNKKINPIILENAKYQRLIAKRN